MRKLTLALALVAALCLVPPAFGGPSPLAIAKKALRVATNTNKALKRSYSRTHPAEVRIVDSVDITAPPFGTAEFDVKCRGDEVAVGANVKNGALTPFFEGSYGQGMLVGLFNESTTDAYEGSIEVTCVWAADATLSAKAAVASRAAVERGLNEARTEALALRRWGR